MRYDFTHEIMRKGVYLGVVEGYVEIEQDGRYPGHWRYGPIRFEDGGETYTLNVDNPLDAALRKEIVDRLQERNQDTINDLWLRQLDERSRSRVLDDLREETVR